MVFLLTVIGSGIGYFIIKLSTKLNLAWPVTLPQAVEFSSALRKTGIIEPDEQIAFARKNKLPVFIANSPILGEEQAEVSAKLYIYAHKPIAAEWAARPDLRERMRQLTGSEKTRPSDTLLSAVKAEFKDVGMLGSGGRPRKNACGL